MAAKVVVVTGCSSGIGKAFVENLLLELPKEDPIQNQFIVFGIARSKDKLEALKAKVGNNFHFIVGDVSNEESIKELVALISSMNCANVDCLILNAGVLSIGRIRDALPVAFESALQTNLSSNYTILHHLIPLLAKSASAQVIAISSGAANIPYIGWSSYCASKAALNSLIAVLAKEEPWLRAISVAPGIIETPMQEEIRNVGRVHGMHQEDHDFFMKLKESDSLADAKSVTKRIINDLMIGNFLDHHPNGSFLQYSTKDHQWQPWK